MISLQKMLTFFLFKFQVWKRLLIHLGTQVQQERHDIVYETINESINMTKKTKRHPFLELMFQCLWSR